ncbi:effector-associated domain EAD1-containing protein [Pelatocladus sp. BLCC-F211]|uniref:VMAP-C domain-containing protein n=1 Tax=Pelatocladus sp. BLCC-F211 TaxID=3342752 RepID=UPI0035B97AE5
MNLIGREKKEFREALIKAFPEETDLKMMLSDQLDERLNEIASGDTQEKLLFNLIEWAEEQNRLEDLLIGALKQNNRNFELRRFFNNHLNNLLTCDESLIKPDLCYRLIPIIEQITDIDLIISCLCQALPDGMQDSNYPILQDLKDSNLYLKLKIFFIFKLLIISYPKKEGYPSILIFVHNLHEEIRNEEIRNEQIKQELIKWMDEIKEKHNFSIPRCNHVVPTNTNLEAYLIITFAPASELDKFCLNAYLELPQTTIIPIDLHNEQSQKGIIVSLKKTAHRKAPQAIVDFIQESENILKIKQKKLGYKTHSLTLEFFLPLAYLHEDIENLKILKLQMLPMGAFYKMVVRSYERITDFSLWNRLLECWTRIKTLLQESHTQQENYIESWQEVCDCKKLPSRLQNKIALKLPCALPESEKIRKSLFREIVLQGIPLVLWTRCSKIPEVDVVSELDNLLNFKSFQNTESLLNAIQQKRYEIKDEDDPQQFLGYHLGILYESDRWDEIPLPEAIPLSVSE